MVRVASASAALVALVCLLSSCATAAGSPGGGAGPRAGSCGGGDAVAYRERLHAGEASLFLRVRGDNRRAPVLLWLHGGPGAAERPLFRYYNGALERRFVVAYWDQRGAGHSFDPAADPARLTVERHLQDLDRVVEHLSERFGGARVILIGHSWGSALGYLYAARHPGKVRAVVGVAQFVSGLEAQRGQYQFLASEARRTADDELRRRLDAIGPPPFDADEVLEVQGLVDELGGYFHRRPNRWAVLLKGILGGYVAPWDLPRFIRGNEVSLEAMHDELLALDLRTRVPRLDVPAVMMLGRYDRQLHPALAAGYFEALDAPRKRLLWFEESAHNVPFEQPQAFHQRLVDVLADVDAIAAEPGEDCGAAR